MDLVEFYKQENNRLREKVGYWRRLSEDKKPRRVFIREGYSADYGGYHYQAYVLKAIPRDLPMEEVLKIIREVILPDIYPYQFRKVEYSGKSEGWILDVQKPMQIDMWKDGVQKSKKKREE